MRTTDVVEGCGGWCGWVRHKQSTYHLGIVSHDCRALPQQLVHLGVVDVELLEQQLILVFRKRSLRAR